MRQTMKKLAPQLVAAAAATTALAANAQSTGPDFSTLTAGIAVGGVVTGILAVALVKVAPIIAAWGSKKILGFMGR